MPLIEGLGDEVTVILVLLTIIIVLLIAWLSTHTRDIPFFSVIVVELSQRAARNRNQNADNPQQSVPSGTDEQQTNENSSPSANAESTEETRIQSDLHPELITDDRSRNKQVISNENIAHSEHSYSDIRNDGKSESIKSTSCFNGSETSTARTGSHANSAVKSDNTEPVSSDVHVTGQLGPEAETLTDSDSSQVRQRKVPSPEATSPPSNSPAVNSDPAVQDSDIEDHEGQIRIRLKYLNDTQRLVYSSPSDTIGQFRRTHFSTELASNKLVRLIFNGQDMRIDTNTLQRYNITDNSVVHCLVTQNLQGVAPPQQHNSDADVQLGSLMLPLFALVLGVIWYLRVTQRQYFNAVSTLSLAGLTFLFLLGCASVWRGGRGHREEHPHLN